MKKILISCIVLILSSVLIGSAKADFIPASTIFPQNQTLTPLIAAPQTTVVQFGGLLGIVYSPNNIFINPGDHVVWDGDFTMHPLVSDSSVWPTVTSGNQFEFVFNTPGVYQFHCFIHGPFGMIGTITVGVEYRELIPEVIK
jgi:plastocyanin